MDPNWPQHFMPEITDTLRPLSREPVLVIGFSSEKAKVTRWCESPLNSSAKHHSDYLFYLLPSVNWNATQSVSHWFVFVFALHAAFYKRQTFVIKTLNREPWGRVAVLWARGRDHHRRLQSHKDALSLFALPSVLRVLKLKFNVFVVA